MLNQVRSAIRPELVAIWIGAVALRIYLAFVKGMPFVDDAYIFMRYADNAGRGLGLVYNEGERVIAFTSPLFAALTTGVHVALPFIELELLFKLLNLASFGWAFWLLLKLLAESGRWVVVGGAVMFALYYPLVYASLNGMETTLYMGCLLAVLISARDERPGRAAFWAAMSLLARPEGLFAIAAVGLWMLRGKRAIEWKGMLLALALVAVWIGSTTWYYGNPIPQSMLAKSNYVGGGGGAVDNALTTYACLATGFSSYQLEQLAPKLQALVFAFVGLLAIPFAGALRSGWRKKDHRLVAGLAFLLVVAFYIVGKPVRIWSWYSAPTCLVFFLMAWWGVAEWVRARPSLSAVAASAFALIGVGSFSYGVMRQQPKHFDDHKDLALFLRERFPAARSIMIGDIGNVGYFNRARIIDVAGLVSPIVTRRKPNGERLTFGDIVELEKPDVIALESRPETVEEFAQSLVRFKSFTDPEQRARFMDSYEVRAMHSYGPIYARKDPTPR